MDYAATQSTSLNAVALLDDGTLWTKFRHFAGQDLVQPLPALPTSSKPIKIAIVGQSTATTSTNTYVQVLTEEGSLYSLKAALLNGQMTFHTGSFVLMAEEVEYYAGFSSNQFIVKTDGTYQVHNALAANQSFVDGIAIPNNAKITYMASSMLDKV